MKATIRDKIVKKESKTQKFLNSIKKKLKLDFDENLNSAPFDKDLEFYTSNNISS